MKKFFLILTVLIIFLSACKSSIKNENSNSNVISNYSSSSTASSLITNSSNSNSVASTSSKPTTSLSPSKPSLVSSSISVVLNMPELTSNWSYTNYPKAENDYDRPDIGGVEFNLDYDTNSQEYIFKPGMGQCEKIVSYTLTGAGFTVVLNGKYKLFYLSIPTYFTINQYKNNYGYLGPVDCYNWDVATADQDAFLTASHLINGKEDYKSTRYRVPNTAGTDYSKKYSDGNYHITIPFDIVYKKGEIKHISFSFGKLD